ncbi:hypothetical protein CAG58_00925 [Vibrio sp. V31_P5A7T61]|uniref:hypothetical protein n=1 Tax=unclassified Vibrio TaxID=2614977 RepID=UPI001372FA40|nr:MULTISPECIES: hypothetical protein [unclassified Vibrio]NAW60532.1 hypothetical protein [Vibrio sp. V31_P5A7T61]NAX00340.1 hypothetical protein [Vibrio sp. V34_P3A8T189]NAX08861.1 hypothetical protein [Vibrio sp. V40_P2S30T141]NAX64084.1 hypothetical protein [Vibrio sp. V32_P6A28T40]
MPKTKLSFTADKVTHHGIEVIAEGVPVQDVINSISEDDAAEHFDTELLLSAIGYEKAAAWLETMGYQVI